MLILFYYDNRSTIILIFLQNRVIEIFQKMKNDLEIIYAINFFIMKSKENKFKALH